MRELLKDVLQTAFRMVPWPTEPGLRRVGSPGRESPVLLTANYDLTVRRLVRALKGVDAWLLVAPAKGINVWCAAAGGHLTTHQVVTALKTSGVAEQVDHRDLVVPQLAAAGVEGLGLFRRSRWRVRFGPVRAEDLPEYLACDGEKSDEMRRVAFPLRDRLEMAAAWAAPTSLALGVALAFFRPAWIVPTGLLTSALAAAIFAWLDRLGPGGRWRIAAAGALASFGCVVLAEGGLAALAAALLAPFGLVALLTFDYSGSTPLEGSAQFEGRDWKITLDEARCAGVYRCVEVCPEACFDEPEERGKVVLSHDERCVRCGACVVQCPKDALHFEDGAGHRVEPEVIRRYKLNLLGKRAVAVGSPPPG